jgi:hypothetical protein
VRSEDFDNASWSKVNTTVTANNIVAPDGLITADTITDSVDGSAAAHSATTPTQSFTSGVTYTVSVYAKAGTLGGTAFVFPASAFTSNLTARFNLTTGTVALADAGITASIIPLPNGWYRCVATATATATASSTIQIRTATTTGSFYQGNGTGTIYLWGAQLETGSSATAYIPTRSVFTSRASSGTYVGGDLVLRSATTNEARYDHDPATGGAKGLLLEAAATNLTNYSEQFDNAVWAINGLTLSANATTAPDGTTTADLLTETAPQDEHQVYQTVSTTAGTTITYSCYIKPNGRNFAAIRSYIPPVSQVACFNLTGSGSVTYTAVGGVASTSGITASISAAGNGWYRCVMTGTNQPNPAYFCIHASATGNISELPSDSSGPSYIGDNTKGIYVWGAQMETGTAPTSYIQTVASQVTRAADISTSTAATVFESSWYRQDEGTVFADVSVLSTLKTQQTISFNDGTSNNRVELRPVGSVATNIRSDCVVGGVTKYINTAITVANQQRRVGALAVKANDFRLQSGSSGISPTSDAVPVVDRLYLNYATFADSEVNGTIRRLTYWPRRLGNEVLQEVTR